MNLKQFLQDNHGELSSTRLVVVLWNVCVMAVWVYISFKTGQMATIDGGVLAGMGIMQATKVGQSIIENKAS